ncbi:MAG: hypothetical protein PHV82_07990 [Victivallaceae bacterium]|nr:hypothetical protein [Victivallaceae bacterium]
MLKANKFIVFLAVAAAGTVFCRAAESSMPTNDSKTVSKCDCSKKTWVELGFFSPIQFPCEENVVNGFRLSAVYTYNKGVNGFDCGVICDSGTDGTNGFQLAVVNRTAGAVNGLSIGLINAAETQMNGVQIGGFYNQAGSDSLDHAGADFTDSVGFQCGFVNTVDSIFKGFQLGCINISNTLFSGLQLGVINLSEPPSDVFDDFHSKEFNEKKKKRSCVQIGVLNFNPNGVFPITLLLNF